MRVKFNFKYLLLAALIIKGTTLWSQPSVSSFDTPATGMPESPDLESEAFAVKTLFDDVLLNGQCYNWLRHLTKEIGHRLSGTPSSIQAVEYCRLLMDSIGMDTVWLQPCIVPRWQRGDREIVRISGEGIPGSIELNALALGNSVGTGKEGLSADIVEVMSLDELNELPDEQVTGKIVFFNRPFDATLRNTFQAYGRAVDQRYSGPWEAAKKGAVAALVRSMTTRTDDYPHTGSTRYDSAGINIPSLAISTADADWLSGALEEGVVRAYVRTTCLHLSPVTSYNVIGELRGYGSPDEIILVGGHLDSWDIGEGAHDNGTGCMQSIDVMRALISTGYQPRRTIRCVMFMNEENGLMGSKEYARISDNNAEFHLAAIESDRGGFSPRGFTCAAKDNLLESYLSDIASWWSVMEPYDLYIKPGGSGADINALKPQGGLLIGYIPDTQRYFDFHHADSDRFEAVNERELKLGSAAMTGLVYMLDKYAHRQ